MALQAGIVGCGNISRFHFRGIKEVGAQAAVLCDINKDAAEPWIRRTGGLYVSSYQEVLSDSNIDVVHVTLPSRFHKEICLSAVEAGKHVICEKTLSETPEDSQEIIKAAEKQDVVFVTSYMKRYIPSVQKSAELLPQLGKVIYARFYTYQSWGNNWEGEPDNHFFRTPQHGESPIKKNFGGGILHCGGSHMLDLIGFLFGRPKKVYANIHTPQYLDYDLRTHASFRLDDLTIEMDTLAHPLSRIGFLRDGWDEGFEIIGSKGMLRWFSSLWDEVDTKASLLQHIDEESGSMKEYRFPPESPFSALIRAVYRDIREGRQTCQSKKTGYDVDNLIASLQRSDQSGAEVDISWEIA